MSPRNLPNLLTALRILLVAPVVWSLQATRYRTALVLFVIAGVTDLLDGYLARRFNWRTRLGSVLDPVADKLLLSVVYVALAWIDQLPWWLALVVVARDLVIMSGALAFHLLIGEVEMAPRLSGKVNTAVQLSLVAVVVGGLAGLPFPSWLAAALVWGVAATALWSGLDYVRTWARKAIAAQAPAQP